MMAGEAVDIKAIERRWRTFDLYLANASATQQRRARRLLSGEARRIAGGFERAGTDAALQQVYLNQWRSYVVQLWMTVVKSAGELAEEVLGGKPSETFDRAARGWIDRNGQVRSSGLARTSRQNALQAIAKARSQVQTQTGIAELVRRELLDIAEWRSATIAETEVHAAVYLGSFAAALASHQPLTKIWTAPRHPTRTCDQHLELHGKRVALRDYFVIGEDRLMYPGDCELGAAPEQTINCRCSMDYERLPREQVGV